MKANTGLPVTRRRKAILDAGGLMTMREWKHAVRVGKAEPMAPDKAKLERAEAKRQRKAAKHARVRAGEIDIDAIADGRPIYNHRTHQMVRS